MKTLIVTLVATFALGITVFAQEISNEEWRNMSQQERKEYKKQQRIEQQKWVMQLLTSRAWVLEAHQIQDRYGESAFIESNLNFIGVDGENSTVQLGSSGHIGWNGVGGITVEGNVTSYKLNEGKKPGTGANLMISVSGASSGHLSVSIQVSADGSAAATVSDNYGDRLTYRGNIVPLAESIAYKGQVVY